MKDQNTRAGIGLMVSAMVVFASQDGLSRYLASEYNVMMVVMVRYWFFAVFVSIVAARKAGGLRAAVRTGHPLLQPLRGVLLAAEICVMVLAFVLLGLVETLAVFASYPLIVAALSGPVLGEHVGWRRWLAIGVGFIGILIILEPGFRVFEPEALVALLASIMFAVYSLLTRFVARKDAAAVSFFWTGVAGAVFMTLAGIWFWQPMNGPDSALMAVLCCLGALGHYLLIRAYEVAEASAIQPFAYLQLAFGSLIGITVFNEVLHWNVALGAGVVIVAGLFTLWRQRVRG